MTDSKNLDLLRQMYEIRYFEDQIQKLFSDGHIQGTTHLANGQEAVAVGAADALEPDDLVFSTYRGHHHNLARGLPMRSAFAEILGRSGGCCGGKGGSMHLTDVARGLLGSYAIVGGHLPIAVGTAWASRITGDHAVTCCFFGDGTTTIGSFHEALNMAAVWQLPVIFVCENNGYSEYTRIEDVVPVMNPAADRAAAYGLESIIVDGNSVDDVRAAVVGARHRAAAGEGPSLIEALTYRHGGHSRADPGKYRPAEELAAWLARDPIDQFVGRHGLSTGDVEQVRIAAAAAVALAAEQALTSPVPTAAALITNVYAEAGRCQR
jgi:acetoin:2,6-dichlorophenolindophenol oxidoreductase subunit alpha